MLALWMSLALVFLQIIHIHRQGIFVNKNIEPLANLWRKRTLKLMAFFKKIFMVSSRSQGKNVVCIKRWTLLSQMWHPNCWLLQLPEITRTLIGPFQLWLSCSTLKIVQNEQKLIKGVFVWKEAYLFQQFV